MSIKYLLFFILFNCSLINTIRLARNDFFTKQMVNIIRSMDRLSKSTTNERIVNTLKERLKYYLFNHKLEPERKECPYEKFINIYDLKKNFTAEEDGTYDLYSHEKVEFDRGYQVSFETSFDDYSEKDYADISHIMAQISDNNVYLGVWAGTSPEFSFHFDDIELANAIMIVFNQIAMWDWSTGSEINNTYYKDYSQ